MINGLLVALGFLTRIPVPARVFGVPGAQPRSLPWYPLVGLLLGALLCGFAGLTATWPPLLRAAMLLAAWVALTGALHLDGLADSADAWIGGMGSTWSERRERTLTIMKDPRSGPAGVVALVLVLLLKFAALASLSFAAIPSTGMIALLLAPLLARAALTGAFLALPYVRSGGLGSGLVAAPRTPCVLALIATSALCLLPGRAGLLALTTSALVFALWWRACRRRLQGMTGDTCGALTELVEATVLVALAAG